MILLLTSDHVAEIKSASFLVGSGQPDSGISHELRTPPWQGENIAITLLRIK